MIKLIQSVKIISSATAGLVENYQMLQLPLLFNWQPLHPLFSIPASLMSLHWFAYNWGSSQILWLWNNESIMLLPQLSLPSSRFCFGLLARKRRTWMFSFFQIFTLHHLLETIAWTTYALIIITDNTVHQWVRYFVLCITKSSSSNVYPHLKLEWHSVECRGHILTKLNLCPISQCLGKW